MPFELAYCELFNPNFHGWDNEMNQITVQQEKLIHASYLFCLEVGIDDFFNDDYIIEVIDANRPSHPIIRNWENIIPSYKVEIVERYDVDEYTICVPKTFWLKLIQRKWKKYYHKMLSRRKNPKNLIKRQIYGKWK